jgi:hypothetical protein
VFGEDLGGRLDDPRTGGRGVRLALWWAAAGTSCGRARALDIGAAHAFTLTEVFT